MPFAINQPHLSAYCYAVRSTTLSGNPYRVRLIDSASFSCTPYKNHTVQLRAPSRRCLDSIVYTTRFRGTRPQSLIALTGRVLIFRFCISFPAPYLKSYEINNKRHGILFPCLFVFGGKNGESLLGRGSILSRVFIVISKENRYQTTDSPFLLCQNKNCRDR